MTVHTEKATHDADLPHPWSGGDGPHCQTCGRSSLDDLHAAVTTPERAHAPLQTEKGS